MTIQPYLAWLFTYEHTLSNVSFKTVNSVLKELANSGKSNFRFYSIDSYRVNELQFKSTVDIS